MVEAKSQSQRKRLTKYPIGGGVCIAMGLTLVYWVRRRKFNRTNEHGVQIFPSFVRRVLARGLEIVLALVALVLVLVGLWIAFAGIYLR